MSKGMKKFREKESTELETQVANFRAELGKEKSSISSGTRAEKPAKIRNLRRDIARMKTIINERRQKEVKNQDG